MKKSIITILLLLFLGLIYVIYIAYGLFESEIDGNVDGNVARFTVRINNADIDNENYRFTIENIAYETHNNVAPGKIAPGLNFYFDIIIDPTNVDVAFVYDIAVDIPEHEEIHLIIERIHNITTNTPLLLTDRNTYIGIFPLTLIENNTPQTIRVYIKWVDPDSEEIDASLIQTTQLGIPVNISLMQYLRE